MTDSAAEFLAYQQKREPKRDRFGRYVLPDPTTGKPVSKQRVTTLSGMLRDEYRLTMFKLRHAISGVVLDETLAQKIRFAQERLVSTTGSDDLRRAAKQELDALAEEAIALSGGNDAAALGTALHEATERADLFPTHPVDERFAVDVAAYRATLEAAKIEIVPEYVETVLVADAPLEFAGTADRLVRLPGQDDLFAFELKTGQSIDYSLGDYAIQLSAYANSTHSYDYASGTLVEAPKISKELGIVCHLPAGSGRCALYWIDLVAGYEALERALWIRDWRKRKNIVADFAAGIPDFAAAKEKPVRKKPAAKKPVRLLSDEEARVLVPALDGLRQAQPERYRLVCAVLEDARRRDCDWIREKRGRFTAAKRIVETLAALFAVIDAEDLVAAFVSDLLSPSYEDAETAERQTPLPPLEPLSLLLGRLSTDDHEQLCATATVVEFAYSPEGVPYIRAFARVNAARRRLVLERLAPLIAEDVERVVACWPLDVPPPKRASDWTNRDLAAIERACALPLWTVDDEKEEDE